MDVLRYLFREYLKKEIYGQVFYKKIVYCFYISYKIISKFFLNSLLIIV